MHEATASVPAGIQDARSLAAVGNGGAKWGHQERGTTWETRGAAGQLRPLLGGTGQCEGSAGLLQNGRIQVGKEGCDGAHSGGPAWS